MSPEKLFALCTAGMVFRVHYNTVAWKWAILADKLARTCNMISAAGDSELGLAVDMQSLAGKLIHMKPLVPAGRFNLDKIMRAYAATARSEEPVWISGHVGGS